MELYHVFNRGVDKRTIFMDDRDHLRFLCGLGVFNTIKPAEIFLPGKDWLKEFLDAKKGPTKSLSGRLVEIHGWCLMGNHYHLLVSELSDGGLTKFTSKVNIGYAKYFNERHKRSGTLFQGRTKKVLIENDAHFLHILHYIHLNPLDFLEGAKDWRDQGIENSAKALRHLREYRWSSYLDYCGVKNFPSVITTELFGSVFNQYERALASYLKDIEIASLKPLTLE